MALEIVLIKAVANNGIIGKEGKIPWKIPDEMKRFKEMTSGHPVIVGRKTYESFPDKFRPLPDRVNYVVTRQAGYNNRGSSPSVMLTVASLDAALYCIEHKVPPVEGINYGTVFVIGGEQIYTEALPLAQRVELTEVNQHVDGDTFFPRMSLQDWQQTAREDKQGYAFVTYRRKYTQ